MLMNQLATKDATAVVIPQNTKELIQAGVSENTLKAYRWALQKLDEWLSTAVSPGELTDAVLAEYITHLHESGKSPATIAQAVAAVKWQSNNLNINIAGVITERTLAGIRRDGRDRGRGQVDGLTRDGMHRVVSRAEAADTLAGLRDSAMIRLMSDCPAPHLGSGGGQHRGRRHYPRDTLQQDRSGRQGRIAFHRRTYPGRHRKVL